MQTIGQSGFSSSSITMEWSRALILYHHPTEDETLFLTVNPMVNITIIEVDHSNMDLAGISWFMKYCK